MATLKSRTMLLQLQTKALLLLGSTRFDLGVLWSRDYKRLTFQSAGPTSAVLPYLISSAGGMNYPSSLRLVLNCGERSPHKSPPVYFANNMDYDKSRLGG